jgi:hypothetical protein
MKTAERHRVQREYAAPERQTGRGERIAFAVLVAAVLLVTTALTVMCLTGTITGLP